MTPQMNSGHAFKFASFGKRLIRWMTARQQRMAHRQIMEVLATLPDSYRNNFVIELERRLSGQ
jgi:hypothetical protein